MELTVRDVSKIFNVPEKTIYKWIGEESFPARKVNEQYRFSRVEILEWATQKNVKLSPELLEETAMRKEVLPNFSDALAAGGIFYKVSGATKEEALQSVVKILKLPTKVDRNYLFQVLKARESLGSTGIGDGIAIPHVRNPIVLHVTEPSVTLAFLQKPVPFEAIDGRPVNVLFTLVSPTVRLHLHLLARLNFILRDEQFKKLLTHQENEQNIISRSREVEAQIAKL